MAVAAHVVVPLQTPAAHVSPPLQPLLSLHGAVLFVKTQPLLASQLSLVQTLPSLQAMTAPALQVPAAQTSPPVQTLPSLQEAVLLLWVQPLAALQLSSVQTLPSSQLIVWPLMQEPPWQVSPEVQALPSLQTATFALC